ncbi:MAG: hypothetical protein M1835_005409 [Candelina submexicana]|nr:MAG: hypothetical protein M1835_005409 [Candelina submexicana]
MLAVGLRFTVRLQSKYNYLGIDDWTILAAWIIVCGMGALQVIGAEVGALGRDGQPIDPKRKELQIKFDYILVVIEKLAYGLIKLSVLLFYRRIFPTEDFRFRNSIAVVLIALWTIAFFLAEVFVCGAHPAMLWNGKPSKGQCTNHAQLLLWFAITDIIGDIAVLTMPYGVIRTLQMDRKKKRGVIGIFMLGILALIAGIIRLGFVVRSFTEKSLSFNIIQGDWNGPSTPPVLWTLVEVSVGTIAACLPALAPLLRRSPTPSSISKSIRRMLASQSKNKEPVHLLKLSPQSHEYYRQ